VQNKQTVEEENHTKVIMTIVLVVMVLEDELE
jgi:hypothetical protein